MATDKPYGESFHTPRNMTHPRTGDHVRVIKGKKVPLNTTWYVWKVGTGNYGPYVHLSAQPLGRGKCHKFINPQNLELIQPVIPPTQAAIEREQVASGPPANLGPISVSPPGHDYSMDGHPDPFRPGDWGMEDMAAEAAMEAQAERFYQEYTSKLDSQDYTPSGPTIPEGNYAGDESDIPF